MNPWHFVLGAYLVTLIVAVVEVIFVRTAHRKALHAIRVADAPPSSPPPAGDPKLRMNRNPTP